MNRRRSSLPRSWGLPLLAEWFTQIDVLRGEVARGLAHDAGEGLICRRPRLPRLGRERLAQPHLERPEQRRAYSVVVRVGDSVLLVSPPHRLNGGNELV